MKWYSIETRARFLRPLNFIIGGRGIGKTYNTIDYVIKQNVPFLYLRNKDTQLDECSTDFGNPFKKYNANTGSSFRIRTEKKHFMIEDTADPDKRILRGYGAALSTFANMRGVDLSDVKIVIFDEFIEKDKLKFDQFDAFSNFYETVNRNRELFGEDPLQVFFLSNAQILGNPILAGYGVIPVIEDLIKRNRERYANDLMFVDLPRSGISEEKKRTALYRATEGTDYYQEAIDNIFAHDSFVNLGKQPLNEYVPVCRIDDIYIWQHKSKGRYYACRSSSNRVPEYSTRDSLSAFLRRYGMPLRIAQAENKLYWSEFLIKSKLGNILR